MNDERPIEKLLRRYAKKRRDDAGAPLDLHPATRRLLQSEVSQQFPKGAAGGDAMSLTQILKSWLPWLGWGVAAVCVVGLGMWALLPALQPAKSQGNFAKLEKDKSSTVELAMNERTPAQLVDQDVAESQLAPVASKGLEIPLGSPAVSPPTVREVNQPAPTLADSGTLRQEDKSFEQRTRSLNSDVEQKAIRARGALEADASVALDQAGTRLSATKPATVVPPAGVAGEKNSTDRLGLAPTSRTVRMDDLARTPSDGIGGGKASGTPASPQVAFDRPGHSASLARRAGRDFETAQNGSQTFANVASNLRLTSAAKAEKTSPVLANFRVEQAGNQLRVIDSDGSTYLGQMEVVPVKLSSFAEETKGAADLKQKKDEQFVARQVSGTPAALLPQAAQEYFYRVEGTNRTLNQQVVFSWNFVEPTNTPAELQTKAVGGAFSNQNAKELQQFPVLLQNSGINGRAQLNAGQEIEINAVPVKQ